MRHTLLLWIFFLGAFVASTVNASAQATVAGRIVLARVVGEVSVTDKATRVTTAAANGREISHGFVVTTAKAASVILVFSNGSTINLKEDSVLDIEAYLQDPFAEPFTPATATAEPSTSTTKVNLTRGELVGNVKKLNKGKGSTFSVQTPVGAAGIRGTTFRVVFRPRGDGTAFFALTIAEGEIELLTGTVNLPVTAGASGEAREVLIETTVDPVTGVVTVTTPMTAIGLTLAPTASSAAIANGLQEVITTLANVIFAPVAPTPLTPPPPLVPQQETTPGLGN